MTLAADPEPHRVHIAGVDGGTETWEAGPDDRFPMCGCRHPEHGVTRWDWMVCVACGLPELGAVLRGQPATLTDPLPNGN